MVFIVFVMNSKHCHIYLEPDILNISTIELIYY